MTIAVPATRRDNCSVVMRPRRTRERVEEAFGEQRFDNDHDCQSDQAKAEGHHDYARDEFHGLTRSERVTLRFSGGMPPATTGCHAPCFLWASG